MTSTSKNFIKSILFKLKIDVTKNQKYDRQTLEIIDKLVKPNFNTVDVGCHKGEILDLILERAPQGKHYGFEPIPLYYRYLTKKYRQNKNVLINQIALSDSKGETSFNFVKNAPAYSGLKKRKYAISNPEIEKIIVQKSTLDNIVPKEERIDFIKIDVEGAEFSVLRGAKNTIKNNRCFVLFEFGMGASDYYGTRPDELYDFLKTELNLSVSTLKDWLKGKSALTKQKFNSHYEKSIHYYFIAHP